MALEKMIRDIAKACKKAKDHGEKEGEILFGALAFVVGGLKACGMSREKLLEAAAKAWELSK